MSSTGGLVNVLDALHEFGNEVPQLEFEEDNFDDWALEVSRFLDKIGVNNNWTAVSDDRRMNTLLLLLDENSMSSLNTAFAHFHGDQSEDSNSEVLADLICRYVIWSTVGKEVHQMLRDNFGSFKWGTHGTDDGFPAGWAERLDELYTSHVEQAAAEKLKRAKAEQAEKRRKKKYRELKKQHDRLSQKFAKFAEKLQAMEQTDDSDTNVDDDEVDLSETEDGEEEDEREDNEAEKEELEDAEMEDGVAGGSQKEENETGESNFVKRERLNGLLSSLV